MRTDWVTQWEKYYSIESLPISIELVPSASGAQPRIRFFSYFVFYLHVSWVDILMLRWVRWWLSNKSQHPAKAAEIGARNGELALSVISKRIEWEHRWLRLHNDILVLGLVARGTWIISPVIFYVFLKWIANTENVRTLKIKRSADNVFAPFRISRDAGQAYGFWK